MTSESESIPKGLRMCEPDLLVVVGSDENKKEYHHHSQVMATHSTYIDTMLATPMKESQSLTLNFPDLRPELWECMVKYLNPLHSRSLSIQMAMNLAPAYDKYSFDRSLKLCDQVLSEMFEKDGRTHGNHVKPLHDLDLLIDAFLLANDANLKDTMKHGVQYFHQTLHSNDRYGKIIFSERQIKKLVPLIVKENLLRHPRRPPFTFARTWSMDEIQSLLFPELFVLLNRSKESAALSRRVEALKLWHNGRRMGGIFSREPFFELGRFRATGAVSYDGVDRTIWIGRHKESNGDWAIYYKEGGAMDEVVILWRNFYSSNLPVPPKTGWEPFHNLARGNPVIDEYMWDQGNETHQD